MGVEESIRALMKSAEEEKARILNEIGSINDKLVNLLQYSRKTVVLCSAITEILGLKIDLKNEMENFIAINSENLKRLYEKISKIEIRKDNLMNEVDEYLEMAQNVLEEMGLAIEKAETIFDESIKRQIAMAKELSKTEIKVEEIKIIDEYEEEIEIEEIQMEHKKGKGITVEDVEDEKRKSRQIVVEDVESLEEVEENNAKKSFLQGIEAKIHSRIIGKNRPVANKTEKEENIK